MRLLRPHPSTREDRPCRRQGNFEARLDMANFLLADVRGALGPYLNVFLVTDQNWTQSAVGLMTMIGGFLGIATQTPVGALIDGTRAKRALVILALAGLGGGSLVIWARPDFWPVTTANAVMAVVGDVFSPAMAALTLGLFRREALARRLGRNSAFDHAGNVTIAILAGFVGWMGGQRAVFLLVPALAVAAAATVLLIPGKAIDHGRARGIGADAAKGELLSGWAVLSGCRPLLVFAGCALLFQTANAPLLPLVGQKLAFGHRGFATAMLSFCIVTAQLVMLPIAILVGRHADRLGRKPILLLGFVILPIRCVLYTFSDAAAWLIAVQILDGIGAGIFIALTPLVLADLMDGTGRFNLAQGAIATVQGIGAAASSLLAGITVDHLGYGAAFLGAAAIAAGGAALLAISMPETLPKS